MVDFSGPKALYGRIETDTRVWTPRIRHKGCPGQDAKRGRGGGDMVRGRVCVLTRGQHAAGGWAAGVESTALARWGWGRGGPRGSERTSPVDSRLL